MPIGKFVLLVPMGSEIAGSPVMFCNAAKGANSVMFFTIVLAGKAGLQMKLFFGAGVVSVGHNNTS